MFHRAFLLALFLLAVVSPPARAATTIEPPNEYAYAANVGWLNWLGDTNRGADLGPTVCSGFIYGADIGWINLGNGTPTNGLAYQNLSTNDFGVNLDSAGNLRGYAYGANVGWLNFEATGAPQLNLTNGILSGYVWGANIGWISLSNAVSYVQSSTGDLVTTVPPDLTISTSGSTVHIVWPDTGSYTLQQTTNLFDAVWVDSTGYSITTSNGTNTLNFVPPKTGNLFFRLANP